MRRLVLAALSVLAACGDGDPCERVEICDVREPRCIRQVARTVACLREQPEMAASVDVNVVEAATFINSLAREPVSEEERTSFERWNAGLSLFTLAPPDMTLSKAVRDQWARVSGFYDTDADAITILDRGRSIDSLSSVLLLAHEMAHALQDLSGVFERRWASGRSGLDGSLAAVAMSEGEADLLEDLTYLRASDWRIPDETWGEVFDNWKGYAQATSRNSDSPVNHARMLFPYPFGTEFVRDAWRAGGFAAVDALYDAVPQSALEVIAGYGAPVPPDGGWIDDLGDQALSVPPAGYERVRWDRFGWWVLDAFCAREGFDCPSSLRDDTFTVLHNPTTGTIAAIWRLRFGTTEAAVRLTSTLPGPYMVSRQDRDVIVIRVDDPAARDDFAALQWTAIPTGPPTPPPPGFAQPTQIACPREPFRSGR